MPNKLDKITEYNASSIKHIENDIEKVKERNTQYIGYLGGAGFLHLIKEGIQNSIDEGMNDESTCREIYILYDERSKEITISDDGRGIPFEAVEKVCTKLQSSGKFDCKSYKGPSAGENGVGLTAINALSDWLEVSIIRLGKRAMFLFNKGYLRKDYPKYDNESDMYKSGTCIRFKPNEEIFGKCDLPYIEIVNWLEKIFITCKGLKFVFHAIPKGKKVEFHREFYTENGLIDYTRLHPNNNLLFQPIHIKGSDVISNDRYKRLGGKLYFDVELIIGFDKSKNDEYIDSYCNFVNTIERGSFVTGARTGVGTALLVNAEKYINKREFDELGINIDDARTGLYMVMNLFTKQPEFVGQNKEKVGNKDLEHPIKNIVINQINDILEKDIRLSKILANYVRRCAEQRKRSKHAKESALKDIDIGDGSFFSGNGIDSTKFNDYTDRTGKYKGKYMLFIVEGESAGGNGNQARNTRFQAIYKLGGVPKNVFGASTADVLSYLPFRDLATILGGIGPSWKIEKCRYDQIIIMTDADSDGHGIASFLNVLFISKYRPLVEAGMLYRAITPLYKVKLGKRERFVESLSDFMNLTLDSLKDVDICNTDNRGYTKAELKQLMLDNIEYIMELNIITKHYYTDSELIENIIYLLLKYKDDYNSIIKSINASYEYINAYLNDENILCVEGVYKDEYHYIFIDETFMEIVEEVVRYIRDVNNMKMEYILNGKKVLLSRVLMKISEFSPDIIRRYKGLGELNPAALAEVGFENMRLKRLTTDDIEKEFERFNIYHGNAIERRKAMMKKFHILRSELDN